MNSVLNEKQRETMIANASEMDQQAAEMRSIVVWSDENKHSKSAAEVTEMLRDPSTAERFTDLAGELLIQSLFGEVEDCVWSFVNDLITHPDELQNIESDDVYSVVRRAIRKATKDWEE